MKDNIVTCEFTVENGMDMGETIRDPWVITLKRATNWEYQFYKSARNNFLSYFSQSTFRSLLWTADDLNKKPTNWY